jgi:hypothetical protein
VYFDELGSFKMLCVRDWFLRRLYCKIAMVLVLLFIVVSPSSFLL